MKGLLHGRCCDHGSQQGMRGAQRAQQGRKPEPLSSGITRRDSDGSGNKEAVGEPHES